MMNDRRRTLRFICATAMISITACSGDPPVIRLGTLSSELDAHEGATLTIEGKVSMFRTSSAFVSYLVSDDTGEAVVICWACARDGDPAVVPPIGTSVRVVARVSSLIKRDVEGRAALEQVSRFDLSRPEVSRAAPTVVTGVPLLAFAARDGLVAALGTLTLAGALGAPEALGALADTDEVRRADAIARGVLQSYAKALDGSAQHLSFGLGGLTADLKGQKWKRIPAGSTVTAIDGLAPIRPIAVETDLLCLELRLQVANDSAHPLDYFPLMMLITVSGSGVPIKSQFGSSETVTRVALAPKEVRELTFKTPCKPDDFFEPRAFIVDVQKRWAWKADDLPMVR